MPGDLQSLRGTKPIPPRNVKNEAENARSSVASATLLYVVSVGSGAGLPGLIRMNETCGAGGRIRSGSEGGGRPSLNVREAGAFQGPDPRAKRSRSKESRSQALTMFRTRI